MLPNSVFPQSDDRLFSYFATESVKCVFDIFGEDGPAKKRFVMLPFMLLGLIVTVLTEPLKVLLRKNIGNLSLSLPRLIAACVLYALWAVLLFYLSTIEKFEHISSGLLAGAVLYTIIFLMTIFMGIAEKMKGKTKYDADERKARMIEHLYRGDSVFFSSFISKTWNQAKVWLWTEPATCFVAALIITILPLFSNPILALIGAPMLATALSFWFNEGFQIYNVWNIQERKIFNDLKKTNTSDKPHMQKEGFPSKSI